MPLRELKTIGLVRASHSTSGVGYRWDDSLFVTREVYWHFFACLGWDRDGMSYESLLGVG